MLVAPHIAEEIFPSAASKQFRLRIDAPDGTRVAETEQLVNRVLATIRDTAGEKNLDLSLGYVGVQGSSYPINDVFLSRTARSRPSSMWGCSATVHSSSPISKSSCERNFRSSFQMRISPSIPATW